MRLGSYLGLAFCLLTGCEAPEPAPAGSSSQVEVKSGCTADTIERREGLLAYHPSDGWILKEEPSVGSGIVVDFSSSDLDDYVRSAWGSFVYNQQRGESFSVILEGCSHPGKRWLATWIALE